MNKDDMIRELATKKRNITRQKALEAIEYLDKHGKPINFNSVAKISGLSKTTLYNSKELREKIESYRNEATPIAVKTRKKVELSEASSKAIIESLKRKNKALQEENKRLKEQLEVAYKGYYDNQ